jgi:hypothetical protein
MRGFRTFARQIEGTKYFTVLGTSFKIFIEHLLPSTLHQVGRTCDYTDGASLVIERGLEWR